MALIPATWDQRHSMRSPRQVWVDMVATLVRAPTRALWICALAMGVVVTVTVVKARMKNMHKIGFYITSTLVALAIVSSTIFVVDQRQFGVVYALGQIKDVITQPGLNFKLPPPFQNVTYIDKRLLTLDNADTEPMLTAEKQRMVIDWFVRWRITDPSNFIRHVGLDEQAGAMQLARVVRNAFQQEINKHTVQELLSEK